MVLNTSQINGTEYERSKTNPKNNLLPQVLGWGQPDKLYSANFITKMLVIIRASHITNCQRNFPSVKSII